MSNMKRGLRQVIREAYSNGELDRREMRQAMWGMMWMSSSRLNAMLVGFALEQGMVYKQAPIEDWFDGWEDFLAFLTALLELLLPLFGVI